MRYLPGYKELTLKYGFLSWHPLFNELHPELRHAAFRRVSISRDFSFCYFRVPKAANSTIVQTLQARIEAQSTNSASPLPKHALHGVPHPDEMPRLFVFTVVRNPITRLLSTYLDKVGKEKYKNKFQLHHRDTRKRFLFEDFLHRLNENLLYKDIHWAPQTSILPYDFKKYDFIGKFECLNRDMRFITKEIFGAECEIHSIDGHKTASKELLNQISNREISIIKRLYEKDFLEFDYDL